MGGSICFRYYGECLAMLMKLSWEACRFYQKYGMEIGSVNILY